MTRGGVFRVVANGALVLLSLWLGYRQGHRKACEASYTRGLADGRTDGDNEGYLAGQRSVECPK
jgi:hypothetical protein